jgi:hypothetical protein
MGWALRETHHHFRNMNWTGIAEFIVGPDPVASPILRAGRAPEYSRAGDDDG